MIVTTAAFGSYQLTLIARCNEHEHTYARRSQLAAGG